MQEKAKMKTVIRASVNQRLLSKASRLFTGILEGRIIEILQNARRAGSSEVQVTNADGLVTVRDNGRGIDDFQKILELGSSGWSDELETSEDPAGVGLFCLAPREVLIRSRRHVLTIQDDAWTGASIDVDETDEFLSGTMLRFADEPWALELVSTCAVFSGLRVSVEGQDCPRFPFVPDSAAYHSELGCRIEVLPSESFNEWHHRAIRKPSYGDNVLVNFHGQVVSFDFHPLSERNLRYLVDLTGEPTGIRLMLPARTCLVENAALQTLKAALELEAYRFIERRGGHELPYKEYLRAKELGISLPEAKPTYSIGLLSGGDSPEPVPVEAPKDFPLSKCYRFDPDAKKWDEYDETNVHLLAALGTFETPLAPVSIRPAYNGYSWADLPTVVDVKKKARKVIHEDYLWGGTLACVESITITAQTSDGRTFCSPVCMAVIPKKGKQAWADATVYVTPDARERLCSNEIWFHLGGFSDEGDTYDTQCDQFERELTRFWADVVGPDEHLRQLIVEAAGNITQNWKQIAITKDGIVTIQLKNGSKKTLTPHAAASSRTA
jgi:hypothetical protein